MPKFINKIERAFLWSVPDPTTGAKCKVNWATVFRPMKLGGLWVMNLDKIATALRLRWPWLEWTDKTEIWRGTTNPCTEEDMNTSTSPPPSPLAMGATRHFGRRLGLGAEANRMSLLGF
jgi:hypothetical protein